MKINKLSFFIALVVMLSGAVVGVTSKASSKRSKDETIVLSTSNTVVFSGEVDGDTVSKTIVTVKEADKNLNGLQKHLGLNKKPVYLFMNTPGGSIQAGIELIEALNGLDRPVNTITLFSASMGFQIVQNLGERLILKNGILMSHRASGQMSGSFGGQRPSQMDNRYNLWLQRMQEFDEQTVKRTNGKQTLESYQKAYADELWLTGKLAVDAGYADRIVTVQCDSSLDGVTTHSLSLFGFKIVYDLDNCPINTNPLNVRIEDPNGQSLSGEKLDEIKYKFMEQYSLRLRTVVTPRW